VINLKGPEVTSVVQRLEWRRKDLMVHTLGVQILLFM
jgi:hypothetical protein